MYLRFFSLVLFSLVSFSSILAQNLQILGEVKHAETKKALLEKQSKEDFLLIKTVNQELKIEE